MGWAFEYVSPVIHPCPETMCISSFEPSFFDSQDPASVIQSDMTVEGRKEDRLDCHQHQSIQDAYTDYFVRQPGVHSQMPASVVPLSTT
jgi:hypothetical protein